MTVLNFSKIESVLPATLDPDTMYLIKTEAGLVIQVTTSDQANPQPIQAIGGSSQPAAGDSIHPFALLGVR